MESALVTILQTLQSPRKSREPCSAPISEENHGKEDPSAPGPLEVVVTSKFPPPVASDDSSSPPPRHRRLIKIDKEQQNLARKQDEDCGETAEDQNDPASALPVAIEVDVEINVLQRVKNSESPQPQLKPNSKRKSTTPQKRRRKPCSVISVQAPSESPVHNPQRPPLVSSSSQVSVISEAAVEELCDLRNYYSNQLRRINYISHECLQPQGCPDPGVMACIREPLKSLRLPSGSAIARTARNLWTRVSSRRKLIRR